MHAFEYILIMLVAVLVSSFANALFPKLPTPLVQIAFGVALTVLPLDFEVHLEPELFMVLFIAPLLFDDAKRMDKEALWRLKYPILILALGLVICTVLAVGFAINWFAPSIPLAAAFALGAALAPTDAVAVHSIKQNAKISDSQNKLLQGESLLNDASSIVSFNFAVAAAITGTFSILEAEGSLLFMFIGGIILGVVLMFIRSALLKYLRAKGIESVSFYVLFEIVTPLLVYLLAELVGVSGIIAVVAAGIAHSFSPRVAAPSRARLGLVSTSVWAVISFTLNGLVFLMLGTQLPYVTQRVWMGTAAATNHLIIFIVLIFVVITALRFIWVLIMRRNENLGDAPLGEQRAHANRTAVLSEDASGSAALHENLDESAPFTIVNEDSAVTPKAQMLSPGFGELSSEERESAVKARVDVQRAQNREARAALRAEKRAAKKARKKAAHADKNYWKLHLHDALVLSLAGVKGALTLSIVLSIPMTLDGSTPFPERDLLILLASGVILLSLLVANITLPLISPKKKQVLYGEEEMNAILDIYRSVIAQLDENATPSSRSAVGKVIQEYYLRINTLKQNNSLELPHESQVRHYAIELQLECAEKLADEGRVSNLTSLLYINSLSHQLARSDHHTSLGWEIKALWEHFTHRFRVWRDARKISKEQPDCSKQLERYEMRALQLECYRYALEKLNSHEPSEELPAHTVALIKNEMEMRAQRIESRWRGSSVKSSFGGGAPLPHETESTTSSQAGGIPGGRQGYERELLAIEAEALDLEREAITQALDEGLISGQTAKLMRDNVAIMELDIEDQLD